MANKYSKPKFIGLDIAPVQTDENKPPNTEFIQANVLERLPFDDNTFDFIFQRFLLSGIPLDKWVSVINELVRVLKPGGYLELVENDLQYSVMGPATKKIIDCCKNYINFIRQDGPLQCNILTLSYINMLLVSILLHERGLDTTVCHRIQNYLEANKSLHNVHCEEKKQLDGQFASKAIKMLAEDYATALIGIKSSLINIVG
ncbi:33116_t:CDS:2, partial [Racocetra persica]